MTQAHFQARKAEKLASQGKLDSAIECHKKALSLLSDATILTDIRVIQQSLHYQKEYHTKQVQFLKLKIEYIETLKREIMSAKQKETSLAQSGESQVPSHNRDKTAQMEIIRYTSLFYTA